MKQWEYKLLERSRSYKLFGGHTNWLQDIHNALSDLGKEGWELVSVITRSSNAGVPSAGFTTDETWVFKRPLP